MSEPSGPPHPPAGPVRRASDLAYEELLERILDLRLPPGTVVNEHAVAAELGLSRMPVHEAVARLALDRFITVLPRRGSVVTGFALQDVRDMFEAREALECGIAHLAARRMSDDDLMALSGLVQRADEAREGTDPQAFLRDDHRIHRCLVNAVRNPLLQDAADRLLLHNLRFWRSYWTTRPVHHATMVSHDALLAALRDRDPDAAEAAMREHLLTSVQLLSSSL